MGVKCGIVGLPNVGKSTLFNALTSAGAESANYPFCTIDPNVGVVEVPDHRLKKITELIKPKSVVPTVMEFVDIAGLVAGASQGEGLGNQFLAHIRETQAVLHVVRCFADDNVIHVAGSVDPTRDIVIINTELMLADLEAVEKRFERQSKLARTQKDSKLAVEVSALEKISKALTEGRPAREVELTDDERLSLRGQNLLSMKPVLYVCNVDEAALTGGGNTWVEQVRALAESEGNGVVMISSQFEAELAQLDEADRREFLASAGVTEPGLHQLIRESYSLLELITFFTAGEKEVRAWTVRKGSKAPQAAGSIHSDFERGFIRAETYHCQDLFDLKTEAAVREAGRWRSEGKDYVVQDGDVMLFRFNV